MGSNGTFSTAKYAKTRLGGPVQRAEHKKQKESDRRTRANEKAYWRLSETYQGDIPAGEYRNLNGSHLKIHTNGHRHEVSVENQTLPWGQIWYPEVPRGQADMPFHWDFPYYLDETEYEKVKPVQVGFNELFPVLHNDGSSSRAIQFKTLSLAMVDGRLDYVPVDGVYDSVCEHYLVSPTGDVSMVQPMLQPAPDFGFDAGLTKYIASEELYVLSGKSMTFPDITDDEALSLFVVDDAH
jgi:hypothetical protein